MKMIGTVSNWLSYAGGALIKVADSAGSTVVLHNCYVPLELLRTTSDLLYST